MLYPPDKLRKLLEEKIARYNSPDFIETDPISIPHAFNRKEDIEISGFLTSIISWGNRVSILKSARKMMDVMDNAPFDFILNHTENDLHKTEGFAHRTFNSSDFQFFVEALRQLYKEKSGLEGHFNIYKTESSLQPAIHLLKNEMLRTPHLPRTRKHLPDPLAGSAAKRINMYLRWMIRKDNCGVDFGIWKSISPSILSCPLDVHSGNVARKLGLIIRKQNDAMAVQELDGVLRQLDINDPVKYDFALFGLGIYENFSKNLNINVFGD